MSTYDARGSENERPDDGMMLRGRHVVLAAVEQAVERSHAALRLGCGAAFSVPLGDAEGLVVVQELDARRHGEVDGVLHAIRRAVVDEVGVQPYAIVVAAAATIPGGRAGGPRRATYREAFLTGALEPVAEWRGPLPGGEDPDPTGATPSQAEVEAWLAARIVETLGTPPERVGLDVPLSQCGLDSVAAAGIAGQLEEWLGRSLSPTLLYNYPTIRALAAHLAGAPDAPPPLGVDEEREQAAALGRIQELSEAELERLLEDRLRTLEGRDAS